MANDRIYQEPTEVVVAPDSGKGQLYQEPVESVIAPDNALGRVYQLPVEVVYPSSNTTTPSSAGRTQVIWVGG